MHVGGSYLASRVAALVGAEHDGVGRGGLELSGPPGGVVREQLDVRATALVRLRVLDLVLQHGVRKEERNWGETGVSMLALRMAHLLAWEVDYVHASCTMGARSGPLADNSGVMLPC